MLGLLVAAPIGDRDGGHRRGHGSRLPRPDVVDVEVGTQGAHIRMSTNLLYTFDPFDTHERTTHVERFPYAITGEGPDEANATFYLNRRIGGCSSLNQLNPAFAANASMVQHTVDCAKVHPEMCSVGARSRGCPCKCGSSLLFFCRSAKFYAAAPMPVRVRRLSQALSKLGVRRIEYLKIDAQGSDFSILRDLLENAPSIAIDHWQVECQFYDRAPPFYAAQNDCGAILEYVGKQMPTHTTRSHVNNCQASEYNIVGSTDAEKTKRLFDQTEKSEATPKFRGGRA